MLDTIPVPTELQLQRKDVSISRGVLVVEKACSHSSGSRMQSGWRLKFEHCLMHHILYGKINTDANREIDQTEKWQEGSLLSKENY